MLSSQFLLFGFWDGCKIDTALTPRYRFVSRKFEKFFVWLNMRSVPGSPKVRFNFLVG